METSYDVLLDKTRFFARDAFQAIKHLPTLPWVLGTSADVFNPKYDSELLRSSYDSGSDYLNAMGDALISNGADCCIDPVGNNAQGVEQEKWFFLNGICTNRSMWTVNAETLHSAFERRIYPLYNPTEGFAIDIVESIFGRTFDSIAKRSECLAKQIQAELEQGQGKIVILAHSQGGIMASNIVRLLTEWDCTAMSERLYVYTFASAADEFLSGPVVTEHFANTKDFVARIGVIENEKNQCGSLYRHSRTGHLLNVHYMPSFTAGAYCNGQSHLFGRLAGKAI